MGAEGGMVSPTTGHILHSAGAGMRGRAAGGMMVGGAGEDAGVEGPLSGLGDSMGSVLHGAGYQGPQAAQTAQDDDEGTESGPGSAPPSRNLFGADPPSQGIVSVGGDLVHARSNGDGTTSLRYMGSAGVPDVAGY